MKSKDLTNGSRLFKGACMTGDVRLTGGFLHFKIWMDTSSVGPHLQGLAKGRSMASLKLAWDSHHLDMYLFPVSIVLESLIAHAAWITLTSASRSNLEVIHSTCR